MPVYNLRFTDSSKDPIVVYPKSLDGPGANRQNTDLRLYGQGAELWGEGVAEDLLRLLENFASPAVGSPPGPDPTVLANPIEGQLWLNSTDNSIYVFLPNETPQWRRQAADGDSYTTAESDARYYERSLADDKFVDVIGDTMTGGLVIENSTGSFKALHITQGSPAGEGSGYILLESLPRPAGYSTTQPPVIMFYNADNDPNNPGVPATHKYPYTKITDRDNDIITIEAAQSEEPLAPTGGSPSTDNFQVMRIDQEGTLTFNGIGNDTAAVDSGTYGLGEVRAPYTNVYHNDSLTTKSYVDAAVTGSVPTGSVVSYAGTGSAPSGWIICNGQAISRTAASDLWDLIGTTYGSGDGSTTFNVPDLRGRAVIGQDGGTGRVANAAADSFGGTLGAETHTLSKAEMPSHNHNASTNEQGGHSHGLKISTKGVDGDGNTEWLFRSQAAADRTGWMDERGNHSHTVTINDRGGSGPHNNMQPTMALNWIIKL